MAERNLEARVVLRHDTEANWNLCVNFIPKQGEAIVYDIDDNYDYARIKIGDGVRPVTELPFQQGGSTSDATISWVRF